MKVLDVETRLSSFAGYPVTLIVYGRVPGKSSASAFLLLLMDFVILTPTSTLRHGVESFLLEAK